MSVGLKQLLLVAVLLVMPLQGFAAALANLLCHPAAQVHAVHANGGEDRGAHQDGDQDQDRTGGNSVWHSFHGTVFAAPVAALPATARDFPVRASAPDLLHDLFFPEQPQRPPLA